MRRHVMKTVSLSLVLIVSMFIAACDSSNSDNSSNKYLSYVADPVQGADMLERGEDTWTDMAITGRVMFTSGVDYVSFGRMAGSGYYYQLVITRSDMYIYKTTNSDTDTLGDTAFSSDLEDNQWYTLKCEISGNHFTGYVDGVKYTDFTDTSGTGTTSGKMFLMSDDDTTTSGRHACFDDIVVTDGSSTTYFTENFESYAVTDNWTPAGGWGLNIGRGTLAIIEE